jgi:hypothetical protein
MLILKIQTFLKSLFFHIRLGLPKSTKEEILYRYNICLSCIEFNKTKSECGICGCAISNKSRFMNKLAWADQSCPLNKWNSIERK